MARASLRSKSKNLLDYSQEVRRMIEERAYYIWESKGRPANSALEDWLQAEKELLSEGRLKKEVRCGRKKS